VNERSSDRPSIWTVGHSTRPLGAFLELLESAAITLVGDVRRFPASRRSPHYNHESLRETLAGLEIGYLALPALGGRRRTHPGSIHTAWRNPSFRGYADYMDTEQFRQAIEQVQALAATERIALMCSEVLWWRCHRALIADYLKSRGHTVLHLLSPTSHEPHPYTSAARIINGALSYSIPPHEPPGREQP
jgi:uncharacterized protein (DUF488 family)